MFIGCFVLCASSHVCIDCIRIDSSAVAFKWKQLFSRSMGPKYTWRWRRQRMQQKRCKFFCLFHSLPIFTAQTVSRRDIFCPVPVLPSRPYLIRSPHPSIHIEPVPVVSPTMSPRRNGYPCLSWACRNLGRARAQPFISISRIIITHIDELPVESSTGRLWFVWWLFPMTLFRSIEIVFHVHCFPVLIEP